MAMNVNCCVEVFVTLYCTARREEYEDSTFMFHTVSASQVCSLSVTEDCVNLHNNILYLY